MNTGVTEFVMCLCKHLMHFDLAKKPVNIQFYELLTFRKPAQDTYPQKIFAHQLITIDDLLQFKKELVQELLTALRFQSNSTPKKWMKSHEVRRSTQSFSRHLADVEILRHSAIHQDGRRSLRRLPGY